jgi:hypothetical protein
MLVRTRNRHSGKKENLASGVPCHDVAEQHSGLPSQIATLAGSQKLLIETLERTSTPDCKSRLRVRLAANQWYNRKDNIDH